MKEQSENFKHLLGAYAPPLAGKLVLETYPFRSVLHTISIKLLGTAQGPAQMVEVRGCPHEVFLPREGG